MPRTTHPDTDPEKLEHFKKKNFLGSLKSFRHNTRTSGS
jgi:hypothetical protein